jgi:hypothetical protein
MTAVIARPPGVRPVIRCPRCDAAIPPEDVHLGNLLAKCRGCLEVFKFAAPEAPGPVAVAPDPPRQAMPEGVAIEEESGARRIVNSWYSSKAWTILLFCVFWDLIAGAVGGSVLYEYWTDPARPGWPPWVFFLAVPGLHIVFGVWVSYYCAAAFLNETVVEVTPESVRVTHGPVPWVGNVELPTADLRQVYCEPQWCGNGPDRSPRYRVLAVLADSRSVELVGGLDGKAAAEFYRRMLEEWLEIEPAPAPGAA